MRGKRAKVLRKMAALATPSKEDVQEEVALNKYKPNQKTRKYVSGPRFAYKSFKKLRGSR